MHMICSESYGESVERMNFSRILLFWKLN